MSNKEQVKLLDVTPDSLQQDKQILDMAEAIQPDLDDVSLSIPFIELYSRIDELPEPILRMLALEHQVYQDEWQLAETIEQKRSLIKDSFKLNKLRGTRWSVERIFDLFSFSASLEEWFEYGGEPFNFKVSIFGIDEIGITEDDIKTAKRLISRYKPLRSALESIYASAKAEDVNVYGATSVTSIAVVDIFYYDTVMVESFSQSSSGVSGTMNLIVETYPE